MNVTHSTKEFGERGFVTTFSNFTTPLQRCLFINAVADQLRDHTGVTDAVAGIDSVTIRIAPATMTPDDVQRLLESVISAISDNNLTPPADVIDVPVCYGGDHGPDIDFVCKQNNLTGNELIKNHTQSVYFVAAVGFAPGFGYINKIDGDTLKAPRLDTPRPRLPAGSIGVAGGYTGIYSLPSPGGWRIIGRTPISLFNKNSKTPFALRPGVGVRFRSITEDEFDVLSGAPT